MERGLSAKLLVVNPSPVRGGAEQMLLDLLGSSRLDIVVACLADGPFVDDLVRAGAKVERVPAGRLRYPWAWASAVSRLARLARDADVVLSWQVKGHYYGTPAARRARRPCAWWDHGLRPARGDARYLIDSVLPRSLKADLVIGSSRAIASRHSPSRVIHPGVPPLSFASREAARMSLGLASDERAVGIVGRLQPWKGQHVLLEAAPAILKAQPRARIVVIGGTPGGFSADYPARLEDAARDLGDRVTFLGQREDVPALLPGLDVVVNASFGEPFGISTVEAMAAGVPVVATEAGGTPEIVTQGETGVLVPVGDARALADAVVWVLEDEVLAGRLRDAARERASEFSVERFVGQVEDLVTELARR